MIIDAQLLGFYFNKNETKFLLKPENSIIKKNEYCNSCNLIYLKFIFGKVY
ncbi:hypothetical protein Bresa_00355|uniref:Uncharacterized protein n=1 Tax=Brenneria salicis ATCC 15712 = DSM 30166 TaxID=714314 RepID=A0A366I1M2_9GAMM|nr:hypothetical protein [Brenneria salicis ATCC 15712 = DSM 30166]RBP61226.1 hypothetical protein DES54_12534 [Brenneria salicis ATCC 15712 = DSM 30166]